MRRTFFVSGIWSVLLLHGVELPLQSRDPLAKRVDLLLLSIDDVAQIVVGAFQEGNFQFDSFEGVVHVCETTASGLNLTRPSLEECA